MKLIAATIAAYAVLAVVSGKNPDGVTYPFEISELLVCHIPNPMSRVEGEPSTIPEPLERLPFAQTVQGDPNIIWLPPDVNIRIPPGVPNTQELLAFLGSDYNPELSALSIPSRPAPFGCISAGTAGSGGVGTIHEPTNQSAIPFLRQEPGVRERVCDALVLDPTSTQDTAFNCDAARVTTARQVLIEQTNSADELWSIWTGLCPLATTWAELPTGYFPPYLAQGTCSNKNCSFPRSKLCEEDFSYIGYVTVLRWDCCYNHFLNQIRWDCGWRKVGVPIVCDCTCACGEVFHSR